MERWITTPRISRENNYNILRIICATAVMYGHMYVLLGQAAPTLYANEINAIGFKMLMVLSGYMITQSCIYEKKGSNYFLKRGFRLLPALIAYTILAVFIIGPIFTGLPIGEYFTNSSTWRYLYNIILNPQFQLADCFAENPYPYAVNGSLWALPVEVSLYFIIYIVLKLLCRLPHKKIILTSIAIGVCILQVCHILYFPTASFVLWGTDWFNALNIYPYFFMGALYALTNIKSYCNIQVAFILFMLSCAFYSNSYVLKEIMAMVILPYLLISIGETERPVFVNMFKNTDISYGIYLYGFAVQQVLINILVVKKGIVFSANWMFLITYLCTIILAIGSWYLIEKPASKMLKEILKKTTN